MSARVLIRSDASLAIGSGHVMRCLSLAVALRARGGEVHFASRDLPGHLHAVIRAQGFDLEVLPAPRGMAPPRPDLVHAEWLGVSEAQDLAETTQALERIGGAEVLVVDHYALDSRWQAALRSQVGRLVVIDDLADRDHDADLLLDQNLGATPDRYLRRVPSRCGLLLGPVYALLRDEFSRTRATLPDRDGQLRRVLVFLGGADTGGYTEQAIEALALSGLVLAVDVVVGPSNPRAKSIRQRCQTLGYEFSQGATDMATRMAAADLAIGAGGTTAWERACLGLPSLTVVVAPNQRNGAEALEEAGCSWLVEPEAAKPVPLAQLLLQLAADPQLLKAMGQRSRALVDGRGATRVARLVLPPLIDLRLAAAGDSANLHQWRNHESVRRRSHSSAEIPREDHERWLAATLSDPQRDLLIAEHSGQPVGVLRFDRVGIEALVSIYLVPGCGGQGYGTAILHAGRRWIAANHPLVRTIRAEVHADNQASHQAFREAGFRWSGADYQLRLEITEPTTGA